jgi:exonuclease III
VVEGKIKATEKHGIHLGWKDDMRHLLAYLTYGPTCMKYNFRHWGHNVDETSIGLLGKKRKALYTESWNGGDTVDGEIEMLFDTNSGNTHLCELTGKILSDLKRKPPIQPKGLTDAPEIWSVSGRVKVSLDIKGNRLKERLKELNDCRSKKEIEDKLMTMKIWKVTFREDEGNEDKTPGDGWCGYLAIDQIRRGNDNSRMFRNQEEANSICQTVDELIAFGTGNVRDGWRKLSSSKLTHREVLLSVRGTLRNWGTRLHNGIDKNRWMSSKNLYGTCKKWDYSLWGEDSENVGYCELRDSSTSQGFKNTHMNWRKIMEGRMMVGTRNHYYVRSGSLLESFEEAFQEAFQRAMGHILRHCTGIRDTPMSDEVTTSLVVSPRIASSAIPYTLDIKDPLNSRSELADSAISKQCGSMKIIFWNSNGWEQDRCNKIAEVAFEEDADVICITDARMDPNREAHVKGYEKILDRITGKKWRIKMTCRPGKRKGCFVGGSLLMTSHNCANVRRVGLVKYGVVDKAEMIWLGQKVTVISTYRPYENDAKGSLRSALKKEYEGNFEDKYWDSIRENTRKGRVVIGGDFNMTGIEMDNRLRNYGLVRSDIGEGYTFKAEIGGEEVGRVIDHALTRELACEARATENGRFLRDHIPLIASVEIRGVAQKKGKRLAQIVVPMIRAGDSGARRRLEKEMEKKPLWRPCRLESRADSDVDSQQSQGDSQEQE